MFSPEKLRQNEIQRYRMLALNGIIAYPVWGFLIQAFEPHANDPIWIRLAISGLFAVLFLASFYTREGEKFLVNGRLLSGWILLIHSSWVLVSSHAPYLVFAGHLVVLGTLLNIYPSKKSSLLLGFAASSLGVITAVMDSPWIVPPIVINVALWSTIAPSLAANFTRIQHMQALIATQNEIETLFQNLKEGLIIHGPDGAIKGVNPAAKKILGMTREQVIELNPIHPEWQCFRENGSPFPPKDHPVTKVFKTKTEVKDVVMGVRKPDGGSAWIKVTASPFRSQQNDVEQSVLVTFSDISEIKRSQKIILEQQSRLEANAKLTALGDMAAGVAHEINNPLAIILGKVYLLRKAIGANKTDVIEPTLERITHTVERIQKIVKGLQTFSTGGEQDPFQNVHLKDLVEEAVSYCQEKIENRNVQIQLDFDQDIYLDCRPIQISQVLVNLIQNSCDAIEHSSERWIRVWARSAHDLLVLAVTDSGPGIPPEVQKKLMQPFFTTKEVGKGTGLGLSITKGLIGSHMGRFWLNTSAPNTTFVIELPLHQQPQKKAA